MSEHPFSPALPCSSGSTPPVREEQYVLPSLGPQLQNSCQSVIAKAPHQDEPPAGVPPLLRPFQATSELLDLPPDLSCIILSGDFSLELYEEEEQAVDELVTGLESESSAPDQTQLADYLVPFFSLAEPHSSLIQDI
ncbi:hypothetical protein GBAR_LOCUS18652 [Geodia barretti]|uniref:Uncharacterized protein n=1 Tax=Geodia barretti TaxID=519541 RepID=A0AA35SPS6_GEOBA|nr:hypothetical protein GBAR_LOCUS18652 [Geodia barretti]